MRILRTCPPRQLLVDVNQSDWIATVACREIRRQPLVLAPSAKTGAVHEVSFDDDAEILARSTTGSSPVRANQIWLRLVILLVSNLNEAGCFSVPRTVAHAGDRSR